MKKDFGAKPWIFPMPVLVMGTWNEDGTPNAMTAAWGCITDMAELSISLAEHATTENFMRTGALTVSIATEATMAAADYVGVVSGWDEPDKVAKAGLHAIPSEKVNAPLFEEFTLALECKVIRFEDGILVAEIVNAVADESILTDGKVDPAKLRAISFDTAQSSYLASGPVIGKAFGA